MPIVYGTAVNADGTPADRKVGQLSQWQLNNLQLDGTLRIGLPILAYVARGNYRKVAICAAAVAGLLWANRLLGTNL